MYLALPDGSGRFTQNFTCSALLRIPTTAIQPAYGTITPCGPPFQVVLQTSRLDYVGPTTPTMPKQCWFGLFPVRSPLLRESLIIFFSSGYLDVSVLRVCAGRPKPGYPIRKSVPQRSFAPQHGLSQLITSFIAIKSQGIRQLLLVAYEKFYSTNMSKNLSVENIGVEPMTS